MANDKKKPVGSFFPTSQPSNLNIQPSKIPAESISEVLGDALEAGDLDRAMEALDSAPRWMQKQPEFMLTRATVLMSIGEDQEALRLFRELERKNPRFAPLYMPLAMYYMEHEYPAHALQAAKRAHPDPDLDEERNEIIELTTEMLQELGKELNLPFEVAQRACIFHEQTQLALDDEKFSEADYFAKEAIKIAPNWTSPYNNRARALYFSGKTTEAIAISESVLARDPENMYAIHSLAIFHFGLNQMEKAQEYAAHLKESSPKLLEDVWGSEQLIMALALVEDTPALWEIAKYYLHKSSDKLLGRSWYCLAVAAVRSGKWKEAIRLMKKADQDELPIVGKSFLGELQEVAHKKQPKLAWMPPSYPRADLLFLPKILSEWESLLRNQRGDTLSASDKRKINNFLQKYPFMITAMKCLLWEEKSNEMALDILDMLENPEADAEILGFALSDTGSRQARISAMMRLVQSGRYSGPKVVRIWFEDYQEWREIELNTQQIGNVDIKAGPKTLELLDKASKTKNQQEAIALLRKAVELEPTSPMAVFNLGVTLIQSGKNEEGEALTHRSVEIDPTYAYGHASIALTEAGRNHEKEALDHLGIVTHTDVISPETAVIANLAWAELSMQKYDLETARQRLDMAAEIIPDHRLVKKYEGYFQEAKEQKEKFGFLYEFQRKSAERLHQKLIQTPLTTNMNLRACMEINTKEMLVGCAHFLRTASSGKKGELAAWLAECLLDPEFLRKMLDENLEEREREALKWMLEADGMRPWKEFVHKYGDDTEESITWDYHEPQSIPGRLRRSGLFYTGTLDGQQLAFIPTDIRPLLKELLK
jgi:tetratricopeptide (TPR) repeat protein